MVVAVTEEQNYPWSVKPEAQSENSLDEACMLWRVDGT